MVFGAIFANLIKMLVLYVDSAEGQEEKIGE